MGKREDASVERWMSLNRRKRAAKLVESKLEVADRRKQKSINIPVDEAKALLTAIRS